MMRLITSSRTILHAVIVLLLVFGALGIVLTNLPDMLPHSKLTTALPPLAQLDAGFADLNRFDELAGGGNSISVLQEGDKGYDAICSLLRIVDPSIPSPKKGFVDSSIQKRGRIIASEAVGWSNPYGSIPVIRSVLIELKEGAFKPICTMRELAFLVREKKFREWSRLGNALALVALALQTMLALSTAKKSPRPRSIETPHQLEPLKPHDEYIGREAGPVGNGTSRIGSGLLVIVSLCIALGTMLFLRARKRE